MKPVMIISAPVSPTLPGYFFNAEVPEMLPTPLLSEDTSAGDGGDCQDRVNAQNHLIFCVYERCVAAVTARDEQEENSSKKAIVKSLV